MKIGILTHHYIANYGAFLQTYSLQNAIQKLFPDSEVYVINYVLKKHRLINFFGWFRFKINKDKISNYFDKIKIPFIFKKFEKKYLKLTKKVNNYNDINNLELDTIIIGSDEVWNYEDKKSYDPIKFGKNLKCKNIITYAPSTGKSDINKIPDEILEGLNNISSFSSRDYNSNLLVTKYTSKECTKVLDPTFLFEFKEYQSPLINKIKNEKYILIYYCDGIDNDSINRIKDYASRNNLKIYGAGDYQSWYDDFSININPFEWVEMFKYAQFVITGTFHGTVFSIKSHKQFYNYMKNKSRIKKISSLLSDLEIGNRELFCDELIDYVKVDSLLNERRRISFNYLKSSIGSEYDGEN